MHLKPNLPVCFSCTRDIVYITGNRQFSQRPSFTDSYYLTRGWLERLLVNALSVRTCTYEANKRSARLKDGKQAIY